MEKFNKHNAEILKTFRMRMDGFSDTIYGRIVRVLKGESDYPYLWEISHNCKPFAEAATAYFPNKTYARTQEECEGLLLAYMDSFTLYGIVKNELF